MSKWEDDIEDMDDENTLAEIAKVEEDLSDSIKQAISRVRAGLTGFQCMSLTSTNPKKVYAILGHYARGVGLSELVRKGFARNTVNNVLIAYHDSLGKFRDLGGHLAGHAALRYTYAEELATEIYIEQLESKDPPEINPGDLKNLSFANRNASSAALTARGEVTTITEHRSVTQEDFELVRKRILGEMQTVGEITEVKEEEK